jgi:hypothetical protein
MARIVAPPRRSDQTPMVGAFLAKPFTHVQLVGSVTRLPPV